MADLRSLTDILVRDYVRYSGGSFLILADGKSAEIGQAIHESAAELCQEKGIAGYLELIDVDAFRQGKPLTEFSGPIKEELERKLIGVDPQHNTVLYIMRSLDGEGPFRTGLKDFAKKKGKIGGLPNCDLNVLEAAYRPENLGFSDELFSFMQNVTAVELTCPRGSKLTIHLAPKKYDKEGQDTTKFKWVNSNGILVPGFYGNPIPAEVYTHPESADGTLVISGSYGPLMGSEKYRDDFKGLLLALQSTPITWKIKDGKITDVLCGDAFIREFVRKEVFEKDQEHGMKIGELGLPANMFVLYGVLTGNLLIDEKGRVHIANGSGYKDRTRCDYDSPVHGDGLVTHAALRALNSNVLFMIDDRYTTFAFPSLRR
jgi:hypothetical protein